MDPKELDIGEAGSAPRARPRKAAIEALERLLRAHVALSELRDPEGAHGLLRPAREDEIELIEAVFLHCGVPLPDTLRAIYRRTLGIGNPVSSLPVLAVPFLRAALPDEGYGSPVVGLEAFEKDLEIYRDEAIFERPPFLFLGHAAPLGLTVSRNGLWSLRNYQGRGSLPQPQDFNLVFEAAFRTFVDQVLLLWANDLAGDLVKRHDLDVTRGARLAAMPPAVQEARATLLAPRSLGPKSWGEVQPLDNTDLLRATRRGEEAALAGPPGSHITVVGLPYGEYPEVAGRIGPGTLLRLRPVDDNPHDPNAVEVWHDGEIPVRVGYVARAEAPYVRALPDGALAWRLRVKGRSDQVLYATLERVRPDEDALTDTDGSSQDGSSSDEGRDLFSRGT
jgi:hypothetical protein